MKKFTRWGTGILLLFCIVVMGGVFSNSLSQQLSSNENVALQTPEIDERTATSTVEVKEWPNSFAKTVHTFQEEEQVLVDIKSVRNTWIKVYDEGGTKLGYASINDFRDQGSWAEEASDRKIRRATLHQINRINDFVKDEYTLTDVFYLSSSQHKVTYYVAACVHGPGLNEPTTALWLTSGSTQIVNMVRSVDSTAYRYSTAQFAPEDLATPSDSESKHLRRHLTSNTGSAERRPDDS